MSVDIFNHSKLKIGASVKSVAPFFQNKNANGSVTRRFPGIQYYQLDMDVSFQAEDQYLFEQWLAEYRYGKPFTFSLSRSVNMKYRGKQTTAISTTTAPTAGGRVVGMSAELEPGTKFNFQNHPKVYEIVNYDRATGTATIFPNLRQQVQAGEIIRYQNPALTLMLTTGTVDIPLTQIVQLKLETTEAI
ncbi:hypothetical protein [Atlantibacter subterraneus]|uniref:hypothetical protein n=1 Tax=Atlantibacter subterraneus TaxID=255519 RepID=UPI0022EAB268|nr:hypothetical protein [Atlantibacter subterranea]MDA3133461.1 hypothetical protein [Atlantibacter subterranea]